MSHGCSDSQILVHQITTYRNKSNRTQNESNKNQPTQTMLPQTTPSSTHNQSPSQSRKHPKYRTASPSTHRK